MSENRPEKNKTREQALRELRQLQEQYPKERIFPLAKENPNPKDDNIEEQLKQGETEQEDV